MSKSMLPSDSKERKTIPLASGVLDYFPQALIEVAKVSYQGNQQHNPGEPLHWARGKSQDHADTMQRHFAERGTLDVDGMRHSAKMVWRALAILQLELEAEGYPMARGASNEKSPTLIVGDRQENEIDLPSKKFVVVNGYSIPVSTNCTGQIPCGEDYRSDGSGHF